MNGMTQLCNDNVSAAHCLDEIHLLDEVLNSLLLHVVDRKVGTDPWFGNPQAAQRQFCLQNCRISRELMPDAASLKACQGYFTDGLFERDLIS